MFRLASAIIIALIGLLCIAALLISLLYQEKKIDAVDSSQVHHLTKDHFLYPKSFYESIGSGPLSLKASQFSPFTPNLSRELMVTAQNTRPDAKSDEICLLLNLKNAKQEQVVLNGQSVFLDYCEGKNSGLPLKFSSIKTCLWIKPLVLDKNSVLIEVVKEIHPEENKEKFYEEKTQFILQVANSRPVKDDKYNNKADQFYVDSLRQAKWWGVDKLIQIYGGEEYKEMSEKHKVEVSDEIQLIFVFFRKEIISLGMRAVGEFVI